jgi:DNA-binding LytR/AlgR family response regulator
MYPITVLRIREDDTTELATIHLSDILYMSVDGTRLIFHTADAHYYQMATIQEYEKNLKHLKFEKLDRPFLVNMNQVKAFDKENRLVYFDKEPDKRNSKYVTVAQLKTNIVKSYMENL